ncbi:HET domain-containing protein [Fusarium keratoplasticum]|uniref:HET domain-containing protein n=1 Tax=Fusarium keratoplasticum TaxID=1328300 RepID=A0ACC0QX31_9HYPO|nr:HET domain-containing protein [Fusarium keratoplasticum]KAI8669581.1 HET domain-containing protein [Fusarium keratoplasticum]
MLSVPCKICLGFDESLLQPPSRTRCTLDELCNSAPTCSTCAIILRAVKHCFPEILLATFYFALSFSRYNGRHLQNPSETFSVTVSVEEDVVEEDLPKELVGQMFRDRELHIYTAKGKPCSWSVFEEGPVIPSKPQELANQARKWINDCDKIHTGCRRSKENMLPRRVVQITQDPGAASCRARLYETSPGERGSYACLSHCWGKHQIIRTTKDNFNHHGKEIPWDELSTTFEDAIEFSHYLGLEFIWIDSLCIIQDDTPDWEREAVKMAEYYANADVTLAATAPPDGTVGFYPHRLTRDEPLDIQGVDKQERPYHLVVKTHMRHPYESNRDETFNGGTYEFPLMTRGWVHQEHVLSQRFLHFGPRELVWECQSLTTCQCGGTPARPTVRERTTQLLSVSKPSLDLGDPIVVLKLWYQNLRSITSLDLTYIQDRLAVMAGIASQLSKGRKGRYLAGLWEDSLVSDLCWQTFGDERERPEALKSVPTWSWGSVSGPIAGPWDRVHRTTFTVKVVDIDCKLNGPTFLGRLDHGILTLEGYVARVKIFPRGGRGQGFPRIQFTNGECRSSSPYKFQFQPDVEDWTMKTPDSQVLAVEMGKTIEDGQTQEANYLILQPAERGGGLFERVGKVWAAAVGIGSKGTREELGHEMSFPGYFADEAVVEKVRIC